jgi:hypothetical protein
MGWEMWGLYPLVQNTLWNPTADANDLREVVAKLPVDHWGSICETLQGMVPEPQVEPYERFILLMDPLIICRAIAVACCGGDA